VRIHRPTSPLSLLGLGLLATLACSEATPSAVDEPATGAPAPEAATPVSAPAPPKREKRGTPLPAYRGSTLAGTPLSFSDLIGKRFVLFGFNPEVPGARPTAEALAAIAGARASQNFAIVGVAAGTGVDAARRFLTDAGLDIPAFFDGDARINNLLRPRFGMRSALWLLLVDADGNVIGGTAQLPPNGEGVGDTLQQMLRLPPPDPIAALVGEEEVAPLFTAPRMAGGPPLALADLAGRPVVLVFFLHTCPHCHNALRAIRPVLEAMPEAERPQLLGISIVNRPASVMEVLRADGLDYFTVLSDADGSIQKAYGAQRGVPVIFGIDGERRIQWRVDGWRDDRDPPLMRMRLARLAGRPVPMLLHKTGYSGNEFCGVCHQSEAATWKLTNHASAYDTLVRHGADGDSECVSCYVVGYGKPGGFSIAAPNPASRTWGARPATDAAGRTARPTS